MSESITAPADAPAPQSGPGVANAPPPALSGEPLSISEAAREMQRRGQEKRRAAAEGQPSGAAPAAAPPQAAQPAAPAPAREVADDIAAALGLPEAPSAEAPAESTADGFAIDGRHYSASELKSLVAAGTDYTRKTQALAEQQRQLQAQQEALQTTIPFLQPELERLQQQIQGVQMPPEELSRTDPQAYVQQLAAYNAAMQQQQRLAQLGQLSQQAHAQAMQRAVEESNRKLAEQFPQWSNPETRAQWQAAIAEWAVEKGQYSKDELKALVDHRHLLTMMKAMQWDRMLAGAKTAAPVSRVQTMLRGQPPPVPATAQVQNAEQAFEGRQSFRNGLALLNARRLNGAGR